MRESMRSLAYGIQHVVESIPIEVNVDVVGDRSIGMSQKLRENFNIGTFVVMVRSKGMPLRYNKDKRKNPVFSRVSAFVVAYSIPFPTLIVNEKSVE